MCASTNARINSTLIQLKIGYWDRELLINGEEVEYKNISSELNRFSQEELIEIIYQFTINGKED